MSNGITKRNISIDVARIAALCCVIMIHSSSYFVEHYSHGSFGFAVGNVFDGLSRIGVPLFVMISGALLLDEKKQKNMSDMIKPIMSTAFLLVFWSVVYAFVFSVIVPSVHGEGFSVLEFAKAVVLGPVHTWYLYMLIALYLATPFLKSFVKKENKNMVLIYIVAALVFSSVRPLVSALVSLDDRLLFAQTLLDKFNADFFAGYIAYYLAGWYIVHVGIKSGLKKLLYPIGLLSIGAVIAFVQFTGKFEDVYNETNTFIFLFSVSAFAFFTSLRFDENKECPKLLALVSKLSFGMYITHIMFKKPADVLFVGMNPIAALLMRFAIVFVLSFAFSYLLSKIPLVKKIIRL